MSRTLPMKTIHKMQCLPVDFLPASARVDFLHFVACDKPAVRTKIVHPEAKLYLEDWCSRCGFVLRVDSESFVCVSREARGEHLTFAVSIKAQERQEATDLGGVRVKSPFR